MNQSVEKGSWPFEGDFPATSLYRRSKRSYDKSVSDSSTCRRAPRLIRVTAVSICFGFGQQALGSHGGLLNKVGVTW